MPVLRQPQTLQEDTEGQPWRERNEEKRLRVLLMCVAMGNATIQHM